VEKCGRRHTFNLQYNVVFEWNKFHSVAVRKFATALLQLERERAGSRERNLNFERLAFLDGVLALFRLHLRSGCDGQTRSLISH